MPDKKIDVVYQSPLIEENRALIGEHAKLLIFRDWIVEALDVDTIPQKPDLNLSFFVEKQENIARLEGSSFMKQKEIREHWLAFKNGVNYFKSARKLHDLFVKLLDSCILMQYSEVTEELRKELLRNPKSLDDPIETSLDFGSFIYKLFSPLLEEYKALFSVKCKNSQILQDILKNIQKTSVGIERMRHAVRQAYNAASDSLQTMRDEESIPSDRFDKQQAILLAAFERDQAICERDVTAEYNALKKQYALLDRLRSVVAEVKSTLSKKNDPAFSAVISVCKRLDSIFTDNPFQEEETKEWQILAEIFRKHVRINIDMKKVQVALKKLLENMHTTDLYKPWAECHTLSEQASYIMHTLESAIRWCLECLHICSSTPEARIKRENYFFKGPKKEVFETFNQAMTDLEAIKIEPVNSNTPGIG